MYCDRLFFQLILPLILSIQSCSPISYDSFKNQNLIQWKEKSLVVLVSTSEEVPGVFNDQLWIRGDLKDPTKSFSLFNEWTDPESNLPKRRLWHGPNSHKLVEWFDANTNGVWEEKHYFNQFAIPKVTIGHVARIDFDLDENGTIDLSFYPYIRFERFDEKGNCIGAIDAKVLRPELFSEFLKTKDITILGKFKQTSVCWKKEPWKSGSKDYIPVYWN